MEPLQRLKKKLEAIDEAVTMTELKKAVEAMLKFSVNLQSKTTAELETIVKSVNSAISRIESTTSDNLQSAKDELTTEVETALNDMQFKHEAMIAEANAKMDTLQDGAPGEDADEETIVATVLERIPPQEQRETPESVRDMLETFIDGPEDDKLDARAIKGLPEFKEQTNEQLRVVGGRGVMVQDEGIDLGLLKILNFTGAGVSVTRIGDAAIISITGGGAGSTVPVILEGSISNLTNIVTLPDTPISGTLMLYINEGFVNPSRYTTPANVVTMGSALDASYTGFKYVVSYQHL